MTRQAPSAAGLSADMKIVPAGLGREDHGKWQGARAQQRATLANPGNHPGTDRHSGTRPIATRRVEIACIPAGRGTDPEVRMISCSVPAIPVFLDAFSAFATGTLFQTERGPVAVEDLWPGDRLRTVDAGFQTLLWRGMTHILPRAPGHNTALSRLTRLSSDSLGIARPMSDLILGPSARIAHRAPEIASRTGKTAAFVPARDLVDGVQVIDLTPPSPVPVFHLALASQGRLIANGVEVESYHPGPLHTAGLRREMVPLFLSCFPHVTDLAAFGEPLLPRLSLADLELFRVA